MKPLPKIGKTYKFYDDGKLSYSRQYNAKVLRIITREEAKNTLIVTMDHEVYTREARELYDAWKEILEDYKKSDGTPWLYSPETDYFIECSIPEYDKDTIWFTRTIQGGWFSMDLTSFWQGGVLDVDGSLTKEMEKYYDE